MSEDQRYIDGYGEEYDEIDIMELLRKLLKDWKKLLKWCGFGAVAGLIIGFSIPKTYTTMTKMAPEIASKSAGGNLSSLASLAGINLSSMGTSDAVSPDLYPEVVNSTPFMVELFSVPVTFKYKKQDMTTDLYDYMKNYTRSPWWGKVVSLPFKTLNWFMGLFREKVEVQEGYADINPEELTLEQSKILKALHDIISVVVDKKTGVITTTVSAQDPHVAATVAKEVIERLQTYVASYRTDKSRKDLEYYQQLFDEARADYYEAQQKYARYMDTNQDVVLQRVRTEQERLRNESELAFQLYNSCSQQLQLAKAKVQQDTPVCSVIQPPTVPVQRSKPSKATILMAFMFLAVCVEAVWLLWGKETIDRFKTESSEA